MFIGDLKDMLEGIRSKLYYKTFKTVTGWDENFRKFVQLTVATCIEKVNENLKFNCDLKSLFELYTSVRDSIMELCNDVS